MSKKLTAPEIAMFYREKALCALTKTKQYVSGNKKTTATTVHGMDVNSFAVLHAALTMIAQEVVDARFVINSLNESLRLIPGSPLLQESSQSLLKSHIAVYGGSKT